MKKHLLAAALMISVASAMAQDKKEVKPLSYSVGVEAAVPVGDLHYGSSFGFGATALGEYKVSDQFGVTFTAGYLHYLGKKDKELDYKYPSLGQIPLLAGGRYYIKDGIYASGQLGVSIFTSDGETTTAFTYAPGVGIKHKNIDATLKFMSATKEGTSLSNIGVRVAYSF
jgi:hypothetical protein